MMEAIWNWNPDFYCPNGHSTLVSIDGNKVICPDCASIEIGRLRAELDNERARAEEYNGQAARNYSLYIRAVECENRLRDDLAEVNQKHDLALKDWTDSTDDAEFILNFERLIAAEAGAREMQIEAYRDPNRIMWIDPAAVARAALHKLGQ